MAPRFIAQQLAHPAGLRGRIMAQLMNRHNARMNAFAVSQLDPWPSDRILELGFGGGITLPLLIEAAGFVAGVDRSREMVARARRIYRKAVSAGRADFCEGSVEALPFESASFGKVCTVNTIYFWTSLAAGFVEIHRVLSPGGLLVVGFLPKERMDCLNMPTDIFTARAADDVVSALSGVGFSDVRVTRPTPSTPWAVVAAARSANHPLGKVRLSIGDSAYDFSSPSLSILREIDALCEKR
jgi:arsenite methyltransferase